eukprot:1565203-Pleurochrysis_carterae.AAC.1
MQNAPPERRQVDKSCLSARVPHIQKLRSDDLSRTHRTFAKNVTGVRQIQRGHRRALTRVHWVRSGAHSCCSQPLVSEN